MMGRLELVPNSFSVETVNCNIPLQLAGSSLLNQTIHCAPSHFLLSSTLANAQKANHNDAPYQYITPTLKPPKAHESTSDPWSGSVVYAPVLRGIIRTNLICSQANNSAVNRATSTLIIHHTLHYAEYSTSHIHEEGCDFNSKHKACMFVKTPVIHNRQGVHT